MFTVTAYTHNGKYWEQTFIDGDYALTVFTTATTAIDCKSVDIIDATTGEVLMEFTGKEIIIH